MTITKAGIHPEGVANYSVQYDKVDLGRDVPSPYRRNQPALGALFISRFVQCQVTRQWQS